jgi:hypothetical protein
LGSAAKIDVGVFSHSRTAAECPALRYVAGSSAGDAHEALSLEKALPAGLESRIAFQAAFDAPLSGLVSVSLRKSFDVDLEPGRLGPLQSVIVGMDTPLTFDMSYHAADASRFMPTSAAGRRLLATAGVVSDASSVPCGETRNAIRPTVFRFDEDRQQWESDSCQTIHAGESGTLSARCTSSGTFSVRLQMTEISGASCEAESITAQSMGMALLFVLAAGFGGVQVVRVTKANGKCKMSLIVVAHALEIVTALLFGAYTLLSDLYAASAVLTIVRLAAFVGLGGLFSAMLYVWTSIFHFAVKTQGPGEQKLAKKRLQVANVFAIMCFIGGSILMLLFPTMKFLATLVAVAPMSVFGLWQLTITSRNVRLVDATSDARALRRQATGLSSAGTAKTTTAGSSDRKNVVKKLWRFLATQSLLVAVTAAQILFNAHSEDGAGASFGARLALCLTEFVALSVFIASFNGLVSSTARLNTTKRLRQNERSNGKTRRQATLKRLRTGLTGLNLPPAPNAGSTVSSEGDASTSEGSSAGSVRGRGSSAESMSRSTSALAHSPALSFETDDDASDSEELSIRHVVGSIEHDATVSNCEIQEDADFIQNHESRFGQLKSQLDDF